jgi:uncharacterized protein (UPF0548 family)
MFFLSKPSKRTIEDFLSGQNDQVFSYLEVGATNGTLPSKYDVDHNRVQLGQGEDAFVRARQAILSWKMFEMGWIQLCWPNAPIETGTEVAVLANVFGLYSLNAARIVYVLEESQPVARFGFAYGTLRDHMESGEERFLVEWNREDDSVWYDILAFSRPQHVLVKLGYPMGRMLQHRFVSDSKTAMLRAVSNSSY